MFLSLKWTNYLLFIYFTLTYADVNKKICADQECREPISYAKTLLKYSSTEYNVMSFGMNEDVTVYSKYLGVKDKLWTVEIRGKRGDVPKQFVREYKMIAKKTMEVTENVIEESEPNKDLNVSTNSLVKPSEVETVANLEDDTINSEKSSLNADSSTVNYLSEASESVYEHLTVTGVDDDAGTVSELAAGSETNELSPSPVIQPPTVELKSSLLLDNVIEYTERKDSYFTAASAQPEVWFPEVTSETNKKYSEQLVASSNLEIASSLASTASSSLETSLNYKVVDGTSIIDDELEPDVVTEVVDASLIQPTYVKVEPSHEQMLSSAVEYYPSSSSSALETELNNLNTANQPKADVLESKIENNENESNLVKTEQKDEDSNKSEGTTGGWFSGIGEFFSVSDAGSGNSESSAADSATVSFDAPFTSDSESVSDELEKVDEKPSLPEEKENDAEHMSLSEDAQVNEEERNAEENLNDDDGDEGRDDELDDELFIADEPQENDVQQDEDKDFKKVNVSLDTEEVVIDNVDANSNDTVQLSETQSNIDQNNTIDDHSIIVPTETIETTQETIIDDPENVEMFKSDLNLEPSSLLSSFSTIENSELKENTDAVNDLGESTVIVENDDFKENNHVAENSDSDINNTDESVKEEISQNDFISSNDNFEVENEKELKENDEIVNLTDIENTLDTNIETADEMLNKDVDSCDILDKENCDHLPVAKMDSVLQDPYAFSFVGKINYYFELSFDLLPENVLELLHELEGLSISPKVVILTIIVGIFVFILEISFIAMKKRFKEKMYLTKLGSLDQKLFAAITERDEIKQELSSLKLNNDNRSAEYLNAQDVIDDLHSQLDRSKKECEKLQAENATLQEELEIATEIGFDLNQMLSEFLTSQNSNVKLQETVTKLQEQLESQQNVIGSLQLKDKNVDQEIARKTEELEILEAEKTNLDKLHEELTVNHTELVLSRENLEVENSAKDEQILCLQQNYEQLLKEGEAWNESVKQLELTNNNHQSKIQELNDMLSMKSSELTAIKEFLAGLKFSKDGSTETIDDNDNSGAAVLNADTILLQLSNVANCKAELLVVKEERDRYQQQILSERDARVSAEESIKTFASQTNYYKDEYTKAHQERVEALTRLDVLSNFFKERDAEMHKELSLREAMRLQSQDSVTSVTHRMATFEQEAELNKSQLAALKTEYENQEKSFKSQLFAQEKKAHENWLAARIAERKLEQMKQEAGTLRNKLTLLEQKAEQHEVNRTKSHHANVESNGEAMSPQSALKPEDRSGSMDLPTSGRSSLFREPIDSEHRFPFLPLDRPLPPFMPPMPILPPPPPPSHLLPMGGHVPLLPPPHLMGPRRPLLPHSPPMENWMHDRSRHPYDHPANRERRTPPQMAPRPPSPYDDRLSSTRQVLPASIDRRDHYREQTPPSPRSLDHSSNYPQDSLPPHLRRYKIDNGVGDPRRSSPVINRNNDNLSSV